jgi:hypothetical protein
MLKSTLTKAGADENGQGLVNINFNNINTVGKHETHVFDNTKYSSNLGQTTHDSSNKSNSNSFFNFDFLKSKGRNHKNIEYSTPKNEIKLTN